VGNRDFPRDLFTRPAKKSLCFGKYSGTVFLLSKLKRPDVDAVQNLGSSTPIYYRCAGNCEFSGANVVKSSDRGSSLTSVERSSPIIDSFWNKYITSGSSIILD